MQKVMIAADTENSAIILDGQTQTGETYERLYLVFESMGLEVYCSNTWEQAEEMMDFLRDSNLDYVYYLTHDDESAINTYTPVVKCDERYSYVHWFGDIHYDPITKYPDESLEMDRTVYLLDVK
jgi:hypothetical protein